MKALDNEYGESAIAFINAGADVNRKDQQGCTALMLSAYGNIALNEVLEAGADVNIADNKGYTALMTATIGDHPSCIKLLLQARPEFNYTKCQRRHCFIPRSK